MLPRLLFILAASLTSCSSQQVCYPSVLFHKDGGLPSSAPFCVAVRNEKDDVFEGLPTIQSADQWRSFLIGNQLALDEDIPPLPIVHRLFWDVPEPWLLPASFNSDRCTESQPLHVNIPYSISCEAETYANEESCLASPFNADFLQTTQLILQDMNDSVSINASSFDVRAPSWTGGRCEGLLEDVRLTLMLSKDRSTLVSAEVTSLRYSTPSSSTLSRTMRAEFEIEPSPYAKTPATLPPTGFEQGDPILSGQSSNQSEFSQWMLPQGVSCGGVAPAHFEEDLLSSCLIRFTSCSEGQLRLGSIVSAAVPPALLDSPFAGDDAKSITMLTPDQEQSSAITRDCVLPSSVAITVAHSLTEPVYKPRRVLVSAIVTQQFARIATVPSNASLVLTLSLRFADVTPNPSYTFRGPPRIDLRLPADFFYPFIYSSSPVVTFPGIVLTLAVATRWT